MFTLVKNVMKTKDTEEFVESLIVYEWSFTESSIFKGSLSITNSVKLLKRPMRNAWTIGVCELLCAENFGVAVVGGECEGHVVFMFDSTKVCMKCVPQEIVGCGVALGEGKSVAIITRTDFITAKLDIETSSIALRSEDMNVEATEDLEKLLIHYNKQRKQIYIVSIIKQWGIRKFIELANELVEQALNGKTQFSVPVMKKEEIANDADKGLIIYQLKYINRLTANLVKVFKNLQFPIENALVDSYYRVVECCERSLAEIEIRKLHECTAWNNEKQVYAGITFRMLLSKAIKAVLKKRGIGRKDLEKEGTTFADSFYYDLAHIEELFDGLEEVFDKEYANSKDAFIVQEMMNTICLSACKAAHQSRGDTGDLYEVQQRKFVWTADLSLIETIYKTFIMKSNELCKAHDCLNKERLKDQVLDLIEIVFSEMESYIAIKNLTIYDEYTVRFICIKQSILDGVSLLSAENALRLAIEYREFNKTIELCNQLKNYQKLYELIDEWREYNFMEVCFQWYVKNYLAKDNKENFDLFEVFEKRYSEEVETFLRLKYPSLLWLHYIRNRKNKLAASEILRCSQLEKRLPVFNVCMRVKN